MRLPAGVGTLAAALAAGFGTLALVGVGWLPSGLALAGVGTLAVAHPARSRRAATIGGALLFGAVLVAGVFGLDAVSLLAGGVGAFLAWTFARTAAGLFADMGRAPSATLELTHLAGTTLLAATGAVVVYLPYRFGRTAMGPLALVGFVLGGVLLAVSLRRFG